jgi:hypothetical protein
MNQANAPLKWPGLFDSAQIVSWAVTSHHN